MKKTLFFFALILATAQSATAQTSSLVKTYIRAEETLRVGTVSSQAVTGFNTTIPSVATNDKLPTTKAVKDYVNASFVPLGGTAGGDLNGTWPSPTVDGLQGVAVSATSPATNQVLKYNGTAWAPAAEADPSITNELQTISVLGQNLTLSGGGGTVAIPTDGNGIYSGSGTIPAGTTASVADDFTILSTNSINTTNAIFTAGAIQLSAGSPDGSANISIEAAGNFTMSGSGGFNLQDQNADKKYLSAARSGGDATVNICLNSPVTGDPAISLQSNESNGMQSIDIYTFGTGGAFRVHDNSTEQLGIQYTTDISATIVTNDPSLIDVRTFKSGLMPFILRQIDDSTAVNGEIYWSTTSSQLSYKDAGGTIHAY